MGVAALSQRPVPRLDGSPTLAGVSNHAGGIGQQWTVHVSNRGVLTKDPDGI